MNQEIRRLKPAQVVPARTAPLQGVPVRIQDLALETWTDNRYALLERVKRATARGEVAEAGTWKPVPGLTGWYSVEIRRLKPPPPRWRKPALIGIGALALLAGVLWGLVLVLPLLLKLLALAIGAAVAAGFLVRAVRGGGITINQSVNIR